MRILVTGVTGYIGGLVAARLARDGHDVRGFARRPAPAPRGVPVIAGDSISGRGLARALRGTQVAYFLIHSMEPAAGTGFQAAEALAARRFADAAASAGVSRIVYLGGLAPSGVPPSEHLASRLEVERTLLEAVPGSVALRASIVIGAGSRSFRFLVRLVERLPVLAIPAWHVRRTTPIDERDVVAMLTAAATVEPAGGEILDAGGPEVISYGDLIERIADLMLLARPALRLRHLTATPVASRVAAVIAGERHELIGPLMDSLAADLLPADDRAAALLGVRLHSLDAAIERALREWERVEPLAAR